MALIPLATEFNYRTGTPRETVTNLYVEATPQGPRPYSHRPRDGIVQQYEVGGGPVYLVVEISATATYVLSGNEVYLNGSLIGTVATGGFKQAARSDDQLVIVSGGTAYLIEYTTAPTVIVPITDPDLPEVGGVAFSNGRFIYPVRDSSQYYYSEINDAANIDGLGFANAEAYPDPIVRVDTLGDQVVFFGTVSLEFHSPTSDPAAPFQRAPGQTQDKGCLAPYSVVKCDNGLFWIGQDQGSGRLVFRTNGGVPQRVSSHSVEAALQEATDISECTAFTYIGDGHTFYTANIPGFGSLALDISTSKWHEWASYELPTFRIRCGGGSLYGGVDGNIYRFSSQARTDGADPIVRVVSTFIPIESRGKCNVIVLEGAMGVSDLVGAGTNAMVEMRFTDEVDGDYSAWDSIWEEVPLGAYGDRSARAAWWQLGLMTAPGRLFEFRYSAPVLSVPYGVMMNVRP